MSKCIIIALFLASLIHGCGLDDLQYGTIVESSDCGSGDICLTTDVEEIEACMRMAEMVSHHGIKSPKLSIILSSMGGNKLFSPTITGPCGPLFHAGMSLSVISSTSVEPPVFEMLYKGKKVGEVTNRFGHQGFSVEDYGTFIDWIPDDSQIIKSTGSSSESFSLACLNCEAFPEKTSVTICLRHIHWKMELYSGHDSETYGMSTPGVCQITQF